MNIPLIIAFTIVGGIIYTFLNVVIRRLVAGVRSREDYDEDVDGIMTEEEKKASEDAKSFELGLKKVGLTDVRKEKPVRFIIVILLGAILSALAAAFFGLTIKAFIFAAFYALLTIIFFVDTDTMEIPPELNYIILGLGILAEFLVKDVSLVDRVIGAACISGFMLILTFIIKGAFGGGDIKLMFAAGFLMGWKGILIGFFLGIFVGAAEGIVLIARRRKGGNEHIPFGPALCIGMVASSLCGMQIVDWYFGILKSMMSTY